jgi:hypothetical protein
MHHRVTLSVKTYHPASLVEAPLRPPPLADAFDEARHEAMLQQHALQVWDASCLVPWRICPGHCCALRDKVHSYSPLLLLLLRCTPVGPQLEQQRAAEAAADAAAAAEAHKRAVQEEYAASLPDQLRDYVLAALEREMARCSVLCALLFWMLLAVCCSCTETSLLSHAQISGILAQAHGRRLS